MKTQLKTFVKVKTGDIIVPIAEAISHDGYSEAYPTGFQTLDSALVATGQKIGGVRDGDLAVITGISGMGKTTFSQNIVLNMDKQAIPTLYFSYEVTIDNLYAKFKEMGISDRALIYTPKKNITGNISWIKEKIIEGKEKYFTKVVFIDHIDYLTPTDAKSSDQQRMRLRNICQELKTLAIDEKVIIFLMVHTKKVQGREVEMQDIAESSGIYQLADFVFSIARLSVDEEVGNTIVNVPTNEGIIKILKNRLTGKQPYMKFEMKKNIIIDLHV